MIGQIRGKKTFRSHSSTALWASSPVCAGAVRIVGVPSALRKGLSAICGTGTEVTAEATGYGGKGKGKGGKSLLLAR